jgi:hypothetical protein
MDTNRKLLSAHPPERIRLSGQTKRKLRTSWRINHLHEFVSKPNLKIRRRPVARFLRLRFDVPGREMSEHRSGWSREFDKPIALPGGEKLVVLRDAANYITALPAKEATLPEWQAAIEALIPVVELGGPTMFARIGVMQALNRYHVRE